MAATSQPLATQIALDVMKGGGSAVDAAIAANAALGLMEPTGNGIGGDLFAIVWDPKTQKLYGYNGSGRSPKSLTLAEFQRRGLKDIPPTGPLPVSVPGAVDGWFALHDRFGRKPMADNLAPAIRYAREGHPVAEVIAYYWDRSVPKLSQYPGFKEAVHDQRPRPRARARCGRTRTWPARCRRSPTAGATPSTRAISPAPSATTSRPMAAT
jgi:gamma-glutamyltranspeptidase/glutathione hydrolase